MGKNLIIKNADFSVNAIAHVEPPLPPGVLYDFNGSVNGETVDTGLKLFTNLTNWTMFVSWNNITIIEGSVNTAWLNVGHYTEAELGVCSFIKNNSRYYTKFCKDNTFVVDNINYISPALQTGKIGFRRNGNIGQITFDGTTWQNSNIVLPTTTDWTLHVKSTNCNGTAVIKIWNTSDKDISSFF